jgi:hypothetical protein
LVPHFETVDAHRALLCLDPRLVAFENKSTIGTRIITQSASHTFFAIDQDGTIFLFLGDCTGGAALDTDGFFAMVTGDPLEMNTDIGKTALLIFIDPQIFERPRR